MKFFTLLPLVTILFLSLAHGQESFLHQRLQLSEIQLKEIIETNLVDETTSISSFEKGNRIRSIKKYSVRTSTPELLDENSYQWGEHYIIHADFKSENFHEAEWILKTDSGFVLKYLFANGFHRYKQIKPGRLKIGSTEYFSDDHFNIIGYYSTSLAGNEQLTYMDPFGKGIKTVEYLPDGAKRETVYPKSNKGFDIQEYDKGNMHCLETIRYNSQGLMMEYLMEIRPIESEQEDDYTVFVHKRWEYKYQ